MSTIVQIDSVTNLLTGTTVQVTLSGQPTGPVTFYATRRPEAAPQVVPSEGAFPTYTLTLPTSGLWLVWAADANGMTPTYAPANVGLSDNEYLNEVGAQLQTWLDGYRAAFDWEVQRYYPGATMKQISYGIPADIIDFPSVLITNPRAESERIATGFVTEHRYSYTIAFLIAHAEEQPELKYAVGLSQFAARILNQSGYFQMVLPSGMIVKDCFVSQGEHTEFEIEGVGFCATGTLIWRGRGWTQDREF